MFFTQINQLMAQSVDITMVIRKSATGMTVSVLPKSNGLKDEAQNHIVPLTLSGLPEELDAGFMNAIANPVRKVSGLLTNMAEFEKQADKAAANSKASKEEKAKETKEEKDKREKYEKHMKKAEELIAAKNHKEAITALGQARLYATEQNRKTVDEKIEEQKRAMNQGSLFDLMEQAEQQPPQQEVQYVAEQKPVAQQPVGQMPPQQPRQYVQQPPQQPAPHPYSDFGSNGILSIDFSGLKSVKGISISGQGDVTDFSSFKYLFENNVLTGESQWSVRECAYNPTYQDMKNGKYKQ